MHRNFAYMESDPVVIFCRILSVPFNNVAVLQPRSLEREFNGYRGVSKQFFGGHTDSFQSPKSDFPGAIAIIFSPVSDFNPKSV